MGERQARRGRGLGERWAASPLQLRARARVPFAWYRERVADMVKDSIDDALKQARSRPPAGRSSAYRTLRDRYDEISKLRQEMPPSWDAIAEELAAAGVRGSKGQVISGNDLRKMWQRVCRDVERAAREKLTGVPARKMQPRDLPRSTMPVVAEQARGISPPDAASAWGVPPGPPGESSLDRVRRLMQGR